MIHRIAILLAALVFLLAGTGAALTSMIRPLPGAASDAPVRLSLDAAAELLRMHEILAGAGGILALAMALYIGRTTAWAVVCTFAAESALGFVPAQTGVLHAVLAPVLFSGSAALVVATSKSWSEPAVPLENAWPPLRGLAVWTPIVLVAQIALGAGFRHNSIGVVWHILNAMIALMMILVLGISTLRQCPGHPALRPAALALLVVTGVQTLLGFGVYLTLLMVSENSVALMIAGAVHVMTGSLTLAASVVLSIQLRASRSAAPSRGTT